MIGVASRTGATIVYGSARSDERGTANSAYVVTPDGIAGYADKCFLWHFDRRWFRAGDALEPVDTPAGRLGIFICADGRIPTIASTLVERGAELLVVPTAWVTSGRDPLVLENIQADLMIPVRARENRVPIVVANKTGVEARSVAYCGKSQIVAADGTVVAIAGAFDVTTLRAEVTIGASARPRPMVPPPVTRGSGEPLPAVARIGLAAGDDRALDDAAEIGGAALTLHPGDAPAHADVAIVGDDAVGDPRALVGPRLDGVRLFVWHAEMPSEWTVRYARTRAAELRAYVVVFERTTGRAFVADPDGVVTAGTFGEFELAAFAYERARTDAWRVAPDTDVREGLVRTAEIADRPR